MSMEPKTATDSVLVAGLVTASAWSPMIDDLNQVLTTASLMVGLMLGLFRLITFIRERGAPRVMNATTARLSATRMEPDGQNCIEDSGLSAKDLIFSSQAEARDRDSGARRIVQVLLLGLGVLLVTAIVMKLLH